MSEVLVDVFSQTIEVGTSLTMTELGPTSAYLGCAAPLPVGSELQVHMDSGDELTAVVIRVHEKMTTSERPPGMYLRVVEISQQALDQAEAQARWAKYVDQEHDPVFPAPSAGESRSAAGSITSRTSTIKMDASELAAMAAMDRYGTAESTKASAVAPMPGPPPVNDDAPNALNASDSSQLADVPNDAAGSTPRSRLAAELATSGGVKPNPKADQKATIRMSRSEVKAITDQAQTSPTGTREVSGKKKRRHKRKKRKT